MTAKEILFSKPLRPPRVNRRGVRDRQVGVKLTADDHARLVEAARRYGVPPSTLARILVVRGTEAALGPGESGDDQDSG
jgi:hypothetical protein